MYHLPKRSTELEVTITAPDVPDGVRLRMRVFTPAEWARLMERWGLLGRLQEQASAGVQPDDAQVPINWPLLLELFPERVVGGTGFTVDGEPFDPRLPEHVQSVPIEWQMQAMVELVAYSMPRLPTRVEKNSEAPVEPSPQDTILSAHSTGESVP